MFPSVATQFTQLSQETLCLTLLSNPLANVLPSVFKIHPESPSFRSPGPPRSLPWGTAALPVWSPALPPPLPVTCPQNQRNPCYGTSDPATPLLTATPAPRTRTFCVMGWMVDPKDIQVLIPGTCGCDLTGQRELCRCD